MKRTIIPGQPTHRSANASDKFAGNRSAFVEVLGVRNAFPAPAITDKISDRRSAWCVRDALSKASGCSRNESTASRG